MTLRSTVFHCDTAFLAMAQKAKLFAGSIKSPSNKFMVLSCRLAEVETAVGDVVSRLEPTFAEETCPKNVTIETINCCILSIFALHHCNHAVGMLLAQRQAAMNRRKRHKKKSGAQEHKQ